NIHPALQLAVHTIERNTSPHGEVDSIGVMAANLLDVLDFHEARSDSQTAASDLVFHSLANRPRTTPLSFAVRRRGEGDRSGEQGSCKCRHQVKIGRAHV